jgi:hypothetical protein
MISINDLKGNFLNIYRSLWLASLGAIATFSHESKSIAEKMAKIDAKQSLKDIEASYQNFLANIQEKMTGLFSKVSIPSFAVN